MDEYTSNTMSWLDHRFKAVDEQGIYIAHQPIYGFREPPCETGLVERYAITYQIMKALSSLKFETLVDIGGAEGYKAELARKFFSADVVSCDLSNEACKRAQEIFHLKTKQIDIHKLPFADKTFDVVVCSETLEHVKNFEDATLELLRIAKKAVIITVPRESKEEVEKNIKSGEPHGHIHALDKDSFNFAKEYGWTVRIREMNSSKLKIARELIEARPRGYGKGKYPKFIYKIYDFLSRYLVRFFGKRSVKATILLDDFVSNTFNSSTGMCFLLFKDTEIQTSSFSISQILDFKVPKHKL